MLIEYQGLLSAGDVQVAVRRHATAATHVGIDLAVASGAPRRIFDWFERDKWSLLQTPRVTPRRDPRLRQALAEYRAIHAEARRAPSPALIRRRHEAEARVRDRHRLAIGQSGTPRPVSAAETLEDSASVTHVSIGFAGDRIIAVKLHGGRASRHELGDRRTAELQSRVARYLTSGHLKFKRLRCSNLSYGTKISHY